ncbi:MAG: hypothetical protein BWY52_03222 [Chloroflexi bacterium ADurb.Bin325]|nr:MAG: hypothetical protein BWY52_03222 [Chloroflexi bacterium ADurb.Bin325]
MNATESTENAEFLRALLGPIRIACSGPVSDRPQRPSDAAPAAREPSISLLPLCPLWLKSHPTACAASTASASIRMTLLRLGARLPLMTGTKWSSANGSGNVTPSGSRPSSANRNRPLICNSGPSARTPNTSALHVQAATRRRPAHAPASASASVAHPRNTVLMSPKRPLPSSTARSAACHSPSVPSSGLSAVGVTSPTRSALSLMLSPQPSSA